MTDLDESVIDEVVQEGERLTATKFVELAERAHPGGPGVRRERLDAYAEAVGDRRDVSADPDTFREAVDDRVTDEEQWAGEDALYAVGEGRVSRFPAAWHAALGGSTDVAAYVDHLRELDGTFVEDAPGAEAGPGVTEQFLLGAVAAVGRVGRERAREALSDAREAGDVVEDVDQHPRAGVYLADDAGEHEGGPSTPE